MRTICILALVVMNARVCVMGIQASGPPSVVSFESGDEGGIIMPVTLNGRGPHRFLLDTGSTHSVISEALARALDAPVVARAMVGSAAGGDERIVVRIDRLDCGALTFENVLPSVVDLDGIDRGGIDGILGQDVLASLRYTIDFRRGAVLWWPAVSAPGPGTALVLEPSDGRFLVVLPQPETILRLVPDSGAGSLLLFQKNEEATLPVTVLPGRTELRTLTTRVAIRQARLRELHVGATLLRNVAAVLADPRHSTVPGTDGLLPLHLFEQVTFDGPRRMLTLKGKM